MTCPVRLTRETTGGATSFFVFDYCWVGTKSAIIMLLCYYGIPWPSYVPDLGNAKVQHTSSAYAPTARPSANIRTYEAVLLMDQQRHCHVLDLHDAVLAGDLVRLERCETRWKA